MYLNKCEGKNVFVLTTMNGQPEELPASSGCAQNGLLRNWTKLGLKINLSQAVSSYVPGQYINVSNTITLTVVLY